MSVDTQEITKAVEKAKEVSKKRNFIQSVDLNIQVKDIDLNKPENRLNIDATLPNDPSPDKPIKVCVFAEGDLAVKSKREGADNVVDGEYLNRIAGDKRALKKLAKEFDFFVAQANLMPLIGRTLGAILGPRGKMPKPIPPTADISPILDTYRRTVRLRMRKSPIIGAKVGTEKMENEKIAENIASLLDILEENLEKGFANIASAYVKTTMGPTVKIKI